MAIRRVWFSGHARVVFAREGSKELLQHGIIALVTFILTAVVVALVGVALELENGTVGAALHLCALALGKGFELLNESGLSVTGVTADDHQTEFTLEQGGLKLLVQIGRHIGGLANLVQTTGTGIGHLALAVERQQMRDKRIGIRLGRLEIPASPTPLVRHQSRRWSGPNGSA